MLSIEEINKLQKENEELKKELRELKLKYTTLQNRNQQLDGSMTEADRYRKALEEIEKELKEDIYCESQECGCDDYEECLRCTKNIILDIINKTKDSEVDDVNKK